MSPLVAIATSIVPDLSKILSGNKADCFANDIAKAVAVATGTDDPADAKKRLDDSPESVAALRIKLEEIAREAANIQNEENSERKDHMPAQEQECKADSALADHPVATPPISVWSTLEVAKIAAPIVSALVLAVVGFIISEKIEASKLELAAADRAQNSLPSLLREFSQFHGDKVDGRRPDLRPATEPYLRVYLKDAVVEGWPLRFASASLGYEIWLSPACNIIGASTDRITGPGLFVFQSEIRRIEIIDKTESKCATAWDAAKPKQPQ